MRMTSKLLKVEHVTIFCTRSFEEVASALAAALPVLDSNLLHMLKAGRNDDVAHVKDHGPRLYLFLTREHGALLAAEGMAAKAIQYEIGNPITAASMTRWCLGAGLYAPLRITLYEDAGGQACFEYDRPSTLFSQFGDLRVTEVARGLDADLEAVLLGVAG